MTHASLVDILLTQKFLQFFSLQILRAKICEKCTEVSLDKTKCCEFFQIFPTASQETIKKNKLLIKKSHFLPRIIIKIKKHLLYL